MKSLQAMGIDVASQKTMTFVLGSLFAGLAGGDMPTSMDFYTPVINFIRSFDPLIAIVSVGWAASRALSLRPLPGRLSWKVYCGCSYRKGLKPGAM
jgi:ABC-type uncharacterized transport system permease subunit